MNNSPNGGFSFLFDVLEGTRIQVDAIDAKRFILYLHMQLEADQRGWDAVVYEGLNGAVDVEKSRPSSTHAISLPMPNATKYPLGIYYWLDKKVSSSSIGIAT